jgi:ribA/ribD-fused uncharacterized protein
MLGVMRQTPLDIASLRDLIRAGYQPKYVFFWGHTPADPTRVGNECLSQWYPSPFTLDGIDYPTAEHFMMTQKARLFGDEQAAQTILRAAEPGAAKKAGRLVRGFDEALWAERRFDIVVRGNVAKFSQSPALRSFLLTTGDKVLVEASPTDRIWGIGLSADRASAALPDQWPGLNLLGFALMKARAELAEAGAQG